MKRLIVKYNSIYSVEERMEIEVKIRREWEERKAVFIPEGCDYEIIDDGVNEAAIWLDQEIEKRKAASEAIAKIKEYEKQQKQVDNKICKYVCREIDDSGLEGFRCCNEQHIKKSDSSWCYPMCATNVKCNTCEDYEPKQTDEEQQKCEGCKWDEYKEGYHPNGNPCDSCIDGKNFSPKMRNRE